MVRRSVSTYLSFDQDTRITSISGNMLSNGKLEVYWKYTSGSATTEVN